jgi:hypothetical protein
MFWGVHLELPGTVDRSRSALESFAVGVVWSDSGPVLVWTSLLIDDRWWLI